MNGTFNCLRYNKKIYIINALFIVIGYFNCNELPINYNEFYKMALQNAKKYKKSDLFKYYDN